MSHTHEVTLISVTGLLSLLRPKSLESILTPFSPIPNPSVILWFYLQNRSIIKTLPGLFSRNKPAVSFFLPTLPRLCLSSWQHPWSVFYSLQILLQCVSACACLRALQVLFPAWIASLPHPPPPPILAGLTP